MAISENPVSNGKAIDQKSLEAMEEAHHPRGKASMVTKLQISLRASVSAPKSIGDSGARSERAPARHCPALGKIVDGPDDDFLFGALESECGNWNQRSNELGSTPRRRGCHWPIAEVAWRTWCAFPQDLHIQHSPLGVFTNDNFWALVCFFAGAGMLHLSWAHRIRRW